MPILFLAYLTEDSLRNEVEPVIPQKNYVTQDM